MITHYILFVIDLATRQVVIADITTNPNEAWMLQMARNLTDTESGMLRGTRYLIVDRGAKYSAALRAFLVREGVQSHHLCSASATLASARRRKTSALLRELSRVRRQLRGFEKPVYCGFVVLDRELLEERQVEH